MPVERQAAVPALRRKQRAGWGSASEPALSLPGLSEVFQRENGDGHGRDEPQL